MLTLENVAVFYGQVPAIHDVNAAFEAGTVNFVVGPNGAGKSTLLLAIAGAVRARNGVVILDGKHISGLNSEDIVALGCSLVPEGRQVFARLTVAENLQIGLIAGRTKGAGRGDLEQVLSHFPILRSRYRQLAGTLSGGEQQQLSIARALLTRPKLMLIDEPSLGLAPLVVDGVYEVLARLRDEGLTMIVVEQQTTRVKKIGDTVTVLRDGNVSFFRSTSEIVDYGELEKAYFGFNN
ncbi:ABC transporter ATP-binding protein [Aminobacter niigataensis]|uniref:ABC transporter ATP-binding protein n=1 Tax=Aminobacter niigataensis TaxID=83265 RepID=UPI0024CD93CD|nr:ABC transporter ATP-binding protein [Aminobacter niigataensis]CAI2931828.1 High-affinity branched-chain amino acid transport ATP-binding protein BraG [Aminobacter niigataensis]